MSAEADATIPKPARHRTAPVAVAAVVLGLGNAAVSAYWLAGGTALLSTVGGEIERWGRTRTPTVLIAMSLVVVVKLSVALVPALPFVRLGSQQRRLVRLGAWVAGVVLVAYGGLLTVVGVALQLGWIDVAADADQVALRWHAFLWDPWFLLWGTSLVLWLRTGRRTDAG